MLRKRKPKRWARHSPENTRASLWSARRQAASSAASLDERYGAGCSADASLWPSAWRARPPVMASLFLCLACHCPRCCAGALPSGSPRWPGGEAPSPCAVADVPGQDADRPDGCRKCGAGRARAARDRQPDQTITCCGSCASRPSGSATSAARDFASCSNYWSWPRCRRRNTWAGPEVASDVGRPWGL
jgi:hypothetical protein